MPAKNGFGVNDLVMGSVLGIDYSSLHPQCSKHGPHIIERLKMGTASYLI